MSDYRFLLVNAFLSLGRRYDQAMTQVVAEHFEAGKQYWLHGCWLDGFTHHIVEKKETSDSLVDGDPPTSVLSPNEM